jgi:hypothetical protein
MKFDPQHMVLAPDPDYPAGANANDTKLLIS